MAYVMTSIQIAGTQYLARLEEVAPGVSVEYPIDYGGMEACVSYITYVSELLREIARVPIGAELLAEFNPTVNPSDMQSVHYDPQTSKKVATARIKIQPPSLMMQKRGQPFFTGTDQSQVPDDSARKKYLSSFWVPLIYFYQPDAKKDYEVGSLKVTTKGVVAHGDKDDEVPWPLTIVLFHELCHAYISFMGLTDLPDHIDEQLVTGLRDGAGYKYSENHYRLQSGAPLRKSYKSRGVMVQAPPKEKWAAPVGLVGALTALGYNYAEEKARQDKR